MGMPDKQFAGFLRQAIRTLRKTLAALNAKNQEEAIELIEGLLEDMQNTLED